MRYGKYIIIEHMGHEIPICFSDLIDHADIGQNRKVISAGFFSVMGKPTDDDKMDISVGVWGKSSTLESIAREEKDAPIIKKILRDEWNNI